MKTLVTILTAIALNMPAIAAVAADPATRLTIALNGIETPKGAVMMGLFDSEDGYRTGKPVRGVRVPVDAADAQTIIEGLPVGRYAIKAFHDIDGDGNMSTNPFGMPVEPYAFSNNAVGAMGPASWADAAFDVTAGNTRVTITIK